MASFNSYVSLPEGRSLNVICLGLSLLDWQTSSCVASVVLFLLHFSGVSDHPVSPKHCHLMPPLRAILRNILSHIHPPGSFPFLDLGHLGAVFLSTVIYYTLWLFNIAMENGPFIDSLPGFTY